MKAKKIGAILLASVMAVSMVPAMSVSAADAKRVCFVAFINYFLLNKM